MWIKVKLIAQKSTAIEIPIPDFRQISLPIISIDEGGASMVTPEEEERKKATLERCKKFKSDKRPWEQEHFNIFPPKCKRKTKPSTKALKEIRKYQQSIENMINRAPFHHVVKEF